MFRRPSNNMRIDTELNGVQYKYAFPNGYGASVIRHEFAYSGVDTFELAVTHHGQLCYSTHITNDVLGYQTMQQIADTLDAIEQLEPSNFCHKGESNA